MTAMLHIHPNARTTPANHAEIARSTEPSGTVAKRYGISILALEQKALSVHFAGRPQEELAQKIAARTWEFSDFLVSQLGVTDFGAKFPHKVTFHDGCHGLRELGIKKSPRALLAKVQGLQLIEMSEAETCCGFGGTFAAKFPMISTAMGDVKCASAAETGAEYIVSNDSSCLMHLQGLLTRQGKPLKTIHLAEVLNTK